MSMSIANFRTDLSSLLGNRGISDARLNRWINHAYLDIAGGVDFAALEDIDTSVTGSSGTYFYTVPAGTMVIKAIYDEANDNLLGYVSMGEFWRRRTTVAGTMEVWTRIGTKFYVDPPPDGSDAITILRKSVPALLASDDPDTDTSAFPEIWDPVIYHLSGFYAFMALGEEQRAMIFKQSAIEYIQKRITEEMEYAFSLSTGLTQARITPLDAPLTGVSL